MIYCFHRHSLSLASVKSRLVLPFWYQLTRVIPDEIQRAVKRLCVRGAALPFKFVEGLQDTEALVSQDVTLACTVSKDDVQVTWRKNGQEIKPDGKKYEVLVDGSVHRLVIHDAQLDDDAEYQCCFGDDVSSCKLHVEGKPSPFYYNQLYSSKKNSDSSIKHTHTHYMHTEETRRHTHTGNRSCLTLLLYNA